MTNVAPGPTPAPAPAPAPAPTPKSKAQCTGEEAVHYYAAYKSASQLCSTAEAKYETLASEALTVAARNHYSAEALAAARDVFLLDNEYLAWSTEGALILPPDAATVQKILDGVTALSATIAQDANATRIGSLLAEGLGIFAKLSAPAAAPAPAGQGAAA